MSILKAEQLREQWKKKGNPPCEHHDQRPERYDEGSRRTCTGITTVLSVGNWSDYLRH